MSASRSFAERHWYRRSALSWLLAPLAVLFALVVALRRFAYRLGLLRTHRLNVPVVVVGNLVVGGTGKTPLVLALVRALSEAGWRPGIVSRGYGGSHNGVAAVAQEANPAVFGDEPVLLARRSGVPVWIGRDRVEAAQALLTIEPQCNLIVCDDGLQHYALARDVEIAVEDTRGHGNGFLLPAGPLREPASRPVDATVVNGAVASAPGRFFMRLEPAGFYGLHDGAPWALDRLRDLRLHAVAGIGHPERFFAMLRELGLSFVAHPFPDHHAFSSADLRFADCDLVLMTDKDAVKCRAFCRSEGRIDLVAARVEAHVDPALFELIGTRLHGSPPA